MKKSSVIISLIMLVILCWSTLLLVACKKEGIIATTGEDKTVEKIMPSSGVDEAALQKEIADLKAQISALQSENGQLKAAQDQAAAQGSMLADENKMLIAENGQLRSAQSDIDAQNARLADENKALQAMNEDLKSQNAALLDQNKQLSQSLADSEAAKSDMEKQLAASQSQAGNTEAVAVADSSDSAAADESLAAAAKSSSQVRNVVGLKLGPDMIDIEGTVALLPHWFLILNAGMAGVPEDFVEDEFPGYKGNHDLFSGKYNFLYDVMGGMGLNWQFNSLPAQPNVYLSTMIGPAWFTYKEDGDYTYKTYLLWRTTLGFDLTIYKNLLFTADLGVDWMKDYDFTPRLAIGLLYRYSSGFCLFGKR
jgi:hypothetical protein